MKIPDWLHHIPSHWEIRKASHILDISVGGTPPTSNPEFFDGDIPWVTIADMNSDEIFGSSHYLSESGLRHANIRWSEPGDLLYSFKLSIGKTCFVKKPVVTNEAIATIHKSSKIHLPFARYVLPLAFEHAAGTNIYGAKILNQHQLKSALIPLPPLDEQKKIADELDRKLAEIDDLIENFRSLRKILLERHASVLEGVLNKELSGVPKQKLSWHVEFLNGDRGASYPSRDEFVQAGIPFVNAGHIAGNTIDFSEMNYVSEEKYQTMGGAKLRNDDVLYCLRGSVGKCGIYPQDHGALASSLVALRAKGKLLPKFLLLLLSSRSIQLHIDTLLTGSAQPNLSVEQLASIRIPVPDISQQISILKSYEEKKLSFEPLIKTIDVPWLLSERKETLINSLLSGERDG